VPIHQSTKQLIADQMARVMVLDAGGESANADEIHRAAFDLCTVARECEVDADTLARACAIEELPEAILKEMRPMLEGFSSPSFAEDFDRCLLISRRSISEARDREQKSRT